MNKQDLEQMDERIEAALNRVLSQFKPLTMDDVRKVVREELGKVTPASISATEKSYLEERGWKEATGPVAFNQMGPGYCDMQPPPDRKVKMGEVRDPKTNNLLRVIEQSTGGGILGAFFTATEALAVEKKRQREPFPVYHIHECTGNPPYHEKSQPIHLQKWIIRDRQLRKIEGPWNDKAEAEERLTALLATLQPQESAA